MAKLKVILVLLCVINFVLASRGRSVTFDDEHKVSSKRIKREYSYSPNSEDDVNEIAKLLNDVSMAEKAKEPAVDKLKKVLLYLDDAKMQQVIDEIVFSKKWQMLELMSSYVNLENVINFDHFTWICCSECPESLRALQFIVSLGSVVQGLCQKNAVFLLKLTVDNFEKFRVLWDAFRDDLLENDFAEILMKIASVKNENIFNLIQATDRNVIPLNKALGLSLKCPPNYGAFNFLLNRGASVASLSLEQKLAALVAAAKEGDIKMTYRLLRDNEVFNGLGKVKPWINAVKNGDCPLIVGHYLNYDGIVNVLELIYTATKYKRIETLALLKDRNLLTSESLISMAAKAAMEDDLNFFKACIDLGLEVHDSKDNSSLLGIAVKHDALKIVKELLETHSVEVNQVIEYYDSTEKCTLRVTCLYYAKSIDMITLLSKHGADLDFKHTKIDGNGEVLSAKTRLHMATCSAAMTIYSHLIELGADASITDEYGCTAKTVFDDLDQLYS